MILSLLFSSVILYATASPIPNDKPHVVVIGGGFGGWGAAQTLCENGCRVTLLDTLPDPTGSTPLTTPSGKPFEAGTRGFWLDYPNINHLVTADLGLDESDVFTRFTNSSFYSPRGLETIAPVFSEFPELPSPLGQVLASAKYFKFLPLRDRASIAGLLYAILDFDRDEATFAKYDRMNAHELFLKFGISRRLMEDFIKPTLLVGLFKPPEELSAAVVMELLYYYALAHQTSFDVRWIKNKSIPEKIIAPLAEQLVERHGLRVVGGSRVESLRCEAGAVTSVTFRGADGSSSTITDLDACVLAVGARGLKSIMASSPSLGALSPELSRASSLNSIDVTACRLWLDRTVRTDSPVGVFARFPELRGAGGTFFMLDQLQGNSRELWGGEDPRGSVVSCDFYNSGALLPLSGEKVKATLMDKLLPAAVPAFRDAQVLDFHVQHFPGAVSWFSPGSFESRPPLEVPGVSNLRCAGDWVRMGAREHGAKGLCQERAYVTGIEAANSLARSGVLGSARREKSIIPIRRDEAQVRLGKRANRRLMDFLRPLSLDSPWVR